VARSGVTVTGRAVLDARLAALPGVVEAGCREAVQAETVAAAQNMRRDAPFDTGKLREGIQAELDDLDDLRGAAVSTAEHTKYVVHGTSDTEANDFITPVAELSRRRFPRRIRKHVLAELRKITE
jgi:hypothetical protein